VRTGGKGVRIAAVASLAAGAALAPKPADAPVPAIRRPSPAPPVSAEAAPARADLVAGLLVPRRVRLIIRYSKVKIA